MCDDFNCVVNWVFCEKYMLFGSCLGCEVYGKCSSCDLLEFCKGIYDKYTTENAKEAVEDAGTD